MVGSLEHIFLVYVLFFKYLPAKPPSSVIIPEQPETATLSITVGVPVTQERSAENPAFVPDPSETKTILSLLFFDKKVGSNPYVKSEDNNVAIGVLDAGSS